MKTNGTQKLLNLDALEAAYSQVDAEMKALAGKKEELRSCILEVFEKKFGHEGASYTGNFTGNTIQRVISVYHDMDDNKLKQLLSPAMWKKVTTEKVSMELFFSAVKLGEIKEDVINQTVKDREVDKLLVFRSKQ